jgi:SAM-dependent methyltransferase
VLTDDSARGRGWDVDKFLASGEEEIAAVWQRVLQFAEPDSSLPALDFGCGAGRLTQALGRRMSSCRGVDISPTMVSTAEDLNREPDRASFVVSRTKRLPFDNDTFGLVYSSIVLQHMQPAYACDYIAEFLRVSAPGGLVVFGLPDEYVALRGGAHVVDSLTRRANSLRSSLALGTRIRQRQLSVSRDRPAGTMEMHAVPEREIRALAKTHGADVLDVVLINSAERDYNGALRYLASPPPTGWNSKQYLLRT